ncbi:UDP-N-acetylmuramoyl-L-alanyl-D-glutamate--2,6-diaminopimelate ligase [Donghicola eburneus]|uniref:UDP-N-acetylmuramoyl-L-alanyl-D-glutamate--2,6-diaminopimelate ligase n=1 Tax=Donghicola eburneus TaxID=393278 RepID=A0A1M4MXC4_9RHOB|nr:UDP-N-acetylmuramoyl-L-alanyl-D-glutamate--2,6-diaminopimelate ligase [Donghicola eburneus]SCM67229.1 UDP-N-acetylmuramoyl-L-alanyl-D-glutamate-2, 6-diaminopimelate ligase [Donghicola eburneus]SFQ69728.1 UDP-N-acetylmuramoylalanyl-D-glutamate--2,6-diaminopimelate ligase [Donghicola eburneus]
MDVVKTLAQLGLTARGGQEARVTGLTVDSRAVAAGNLFAALPGVKVHGAEFVATALGAGASAILTDAAGAEICEADVRAAGAALIVTEEPRAALSYAAALWFEKQPETIVAVTGTNGKTSVASFTRQIWQALGVPAVNLGTTGVEGDWEYPLHHTTPEPITLHRALAGAAAEGITHAAMEASSHGLDQRRLDAVRLKAAGFTNFTQDHLDYHHTFEEYFAAKAGLFDRVLPEEGTAVLNIDDPKVAEFAEHLLDEGRCVITVGRHDDADLEITAQRFDGTGQELRLSYDHQVALVRLNLIGGFQAENVLIAAGLVMATGVGFQDVSNALPRLTTVRGRMQLAATRDNSASVFVDYAHTPDAVAKALAAMRPHVMGRVVAIIGAGGDRDKTKRPLMGEAAAKNADVVFVTDDNPRSEDPATIRAEVMAGCPNAIEVGDRAEAILRAVDMLQPGDALLIAGKGHERGQIVGDVTYPFDDVEQASLAVSVLDGKMV